MNKVILKGNLVKDIELKYTINNKAVARFTLAVNEGYGDNKRTNFITCEVWNKLAENLAKYCGKGSSLLLEGSIRTESYDGNDGQKKYGTKVVVETLEFINSKTFAKNCKESAEICKETANNCKETAKEDDDPFKDFGETMEITDEDIPW